MPQTLTPSTRRVSTAKWDDLRTLSFTMPSLDESLSAELDDLAARSLCRQLVPAQPCGHTITRQGRTLINLAGNDYLGLSDHPRLKQAAVDAIQTYGVGSGASRLVTGTCTLHTQVEADFAKFKHAPASLILPTGFMANLAALTALAGKGDILCLDKLCHASLIDAAKLSGAQVRTYPHLELSKLQRLLENHAAASPKARRFIVTDSVFSMDGDCANLPALCDLADQYHASLVVDEAHATGVLGPDAGGLAEHQGAAERVYTAGAGGLMVSTASKALGSLGGIISASQTLIDALVNKARPLIYTTAIPPAQAAVIGEAIRVVRDEPDRPEKLRAISTAVRHRLREQGWPLPGKENDPPTPIVPLIVGQPEQALALSNTLGDAGFLALPIRPPTVPPGSARVRLALRWDLSDDEITRLCAAVDQHG